MGRALKALPCAVLRAFALSFSQLTFNPGRQAGLTLPPARLSQSISFRGYGLRKAFILFIILVAAPGISLAATPAGTVISNTATAQFSVYSSAPITKPSNTVDVTTVTYHTPSQIEFMQYAPAHPSPDNILVNNTDYASGGSGGPFVSLPAPTPFGSSTPLDLSNPVPLITSNLFHAGNIIFIRLTDLDQNADSLLMETVTLTLTNNGTGDTEVLRLYETGTDTGVFAAYLMTTTAAATAYDGSLSVTDGSTTQASYTDSNDGADTTASAALVDPFGLIFNSNNGNPVDGVTVSLIDASTGLAATVYGDDGVSTFPSTVTSGGTATDSGGTSYTFSTGSYRFPYLLPGSYRLLVTPPSGYEAPSTVSTAELQALPGAPFAIVNPGSRGEVFIVNPGPALHIDYPVDPLITSLYVRKKALKSFVSHGDFLQYEVEVINGTVADITNTTISDVLPQGFRYEKGSLKTGGVKGNEPLISPDGRTLSVNIGTLATGASRKLTYVTEVASGAKRGEAHNIAKAAGDGGMESNLAKATVTVKEAFFRSETLITGQVMAGLCDEKEAPFPVEGIRIYMEDGTSVISDKKGMFHFKGVSKGTHLVQLDVDTIPPMYEVVSCHENSRFAGRTFSRFVDLQGGTLWRADFHLALKPRMAGEISLQLKSRFRKYEEAKEKSSFTNLSSREPSQLILDKNTDDQSRKEMKKIIKNRELEREKRIVDLSIPFSIGQVDVRNMRLTLILPDGARYLPGSTFYDNEPLEDPFIMGNSLTYNIGNGQAGTTRELKLSAAVVSGKGYRTLTTKTLITFDTPAIKNVRTPLAENILESVEEEEQVENPDIILRPHFQPMSAELDEDYKRQLDDLIEALKDASVTHIYVTGHTDSLAIRKRSRTVYADNYELSKARAESVGNYIIDKLRLDPFHLSFEGRGPDEPIATNKTEKGRALNRRVELKVESVRLVLWSHLDHVKDESPIEKVETEGLRPGETWQEPKKIEVASDFEKALRDDSPGFKWLWPKADYYPAIPSVKVSIKHDSSNLVMLYLHGEKVNSVNFEGITKSADGKVYKSTWLGVDLREGENRFLAKLIDKEGKELDRMERTLHYAGLPVKATIAEEKSFLLANGKSSPLIAVKLTDKNGEPAREGLIGQFTVDPPYLSNDFNEEVNKKGIGGGKKEFYRYKIEKEGIAYIKLAPTTKTGEVVLRFRLDNGMEEARSWLSSEARNWILVGFGEGTAGYNTLSGNMEAINENDIEEDLYYDGRIALYAKGRIKGRWLLTMAYDSDKLRGLEREKLHQTVDPDAYYTLYGDGSEQQHDAATAGELFLKIEKDRFYALFGDYDTGLTSTELSRYSRTMNGFKSEMKGENFEYKLFAGDTANAFIKDEIRGDGTSGLYSLSKNNMVINSESVEIEVRDRFRSEVILSSRKLSRHVDYSIDYDEGTLFFREAVFSTDSNFNPVYIVVDYETNNSSETAFNYGGRGAVKSLGGALTTGLSHVHEGTPGGEGDLYGFDLKSELTKSLSVSGEIASSDSEYFGLSRSGKAYLAEISHISDKVRGKLYYREMEEDFGLGQQRGSEYAMKKAGLEGNYLISKNTGLSAQLFRQSNLLTGAERDHGEMKATYSQKKYSLFGGFRKAADKYGDGTSDESSHVTVGGNRTLFANRLNVRLNHEQALAGESENADYPSRTIIGTDYKLSKWTSLFLDHEIAHSAYEKSQATRAGFKTNPWAGGEFSSSLDRRISEKGSRLYSNLGLKQTVQLTKGWSMDAGLDRVETIREKNRKSLNTSIPYATGSSEDFTAMSAGLAYSAEKWDWTMRGERRYADTSHKTGFFTGANGEVRKGLGLALGLKAFKTDYDNGDRRRNADLRFSLASRPAFTKWIILNRLDLIYNEEESSSLHYDNWRIVNNLNSNYKLNDKMMVAFQYGAKYVNENIDEDDYSGYTDLIGLEGIYDVTKKFDVAFRANMLHSWHSHNCDYGSGLALGYNFAENVWASLGYNFTGFKDRDFSKADYTAQGPYIKFRFKFDQQTVRELVKGTELR